MIGTIGTTPFSTIDYSRRFASSAQMAMRARVRAYGLQSRAAESNRQNALSRAQTAAGWMQTISNLAGRMGELSVMANDGTKSAVDRQAIQYEFSQMQRAIQSITTGPDALGKFNGIPLFQGGLLSYGGLSTSGQLLAVA